MKNNGKRNCFISAGLLLNTINIIASRFLPSVLPYAVHIVLSLTSVALVVAGSVVMARTNPALYRFRQAKLRLLRRIVGKKD